MTVSSSSSKVVWLGNGATTVWSYNFEIDATAYVVLTFTDALGNVTTLSSAVWSISGIGNQTGGTVTYPLSGTPIAVGTTLTLQRVVPYTQPTNLTNQAGLWPTVVMAMDDNLEYQIQQLAELASRAIVVSVSETMAPPLPPPAARANMNLTFNAQGAPVATLPAAGNAPVSSAMAAFVAAASTAAALALLNTLLSGSGAVQRTLPSKLYDQISAADFGAVGNNVVDDTNAVQAAMNYCATTGRTLILIGLSGNTFKITSPLTITTNGVRISGVNNVQSELIASGNFAAILSIGAAAANVWVEHVGFVQTGTTTQCVALAVGSQAIKFSDCGFTGNLTGNLVYSQAAGFLDFLDCFWLASAANTVCLVFDGYNQNTTVSGGRAGGGGCFAEVVDTAGPGAQGVTFCNGFKSVCTGAFSISIGGAAYYTTIADCILDQAATNAVLIGGNVSLVTIADSWLGLAAGSTGNALLIAASTSNGIDVLGNTFFGGSSNIFVGASASLRVTAVRIIDNTFQSATTTAVAMDSVLGCTVEDNTDLGTPSAGSWATIGTFGNGVYTFGGNSWYTSTPSSFHAGSSYRSTPDRGITLANKGVAVSASGTSVVVPHGIVGAAPNVVKITQLGGTGMNSNVSAITGTNFTISYGTSGAATFMWEAELFT